MIDGTWIYPAVECRWLYICYIFILWWLYSGCEAVTCVRKHSREDQKPLLILPDLIYNDAARLNILLFHRAVSWGDIQVDNSSRIPFRGEMGRVWATSILWSNLKLAGNSSLESDQICRKMHIIREFGFQKWARNRNEWSLTIKLHWWMLSAVKFE